MGKIADAINKYTKERYGSQEEQIQDKDLEALMTYDRETGHLLKYDKSTGKVNHSSMDVVKDRELIQRLLENNLIFPGGKLTPEGIGEVEKLEKQNLQPQKPVALDSEPVEFPINVIKQADTASEVEKQASKLKRFPQKEKPRAPKSETDAKPAPIEVEHERAPISENKPPVEKKLKPLEVVSAETKEPKELTADLPLIDVIGKEAVKEKALSEPEQPTAESIRSKYSPADIDKNLVSLLDPHSYEAEQFKILRTNILYPISGKPPRSILVTSALPAEGKSFVASNLAISIALNIDKHVLLIDSDLRKPELHRRFGFRKAPGLSDYLAKGVHLESLLLKTEVNKLTILPGGPPPPNPSELMSSERMDALLKEVMNRYSDRLIVIDSPPPSMAAETSVLSRQVDGIVLVVKYGKTPKDQMSDLIDTLGADKIIGCVINNLDRSTSKYYGYSKYGKYGKRYKK